MTAGQIDDAQAPESQADRPVDVVSLVIRPPMDERPRHARQNLGASRVDPAGPIEDARYAAHRLRSTSLRYSRSYRSAMAPRENSRTTRRRPAAPCSRRSRSSAA